MLWLHQMELIGVVHTLYFFESQMGFPVPWRPEALNILQPIFFCLDLYFLIPSTVPKLHTRNQVFIEVWENNFHLYRRGCVVLFCKNLVQLLRTFKTLGVITNCKRKVLRSFNIVYSTKQRRICGHRKLCLVCVSSRLFLCIVGTFKLVNNSLNGKHMDTKVKPIKFLTT